MGTSISMWGGGRMGRLEVMFGLITPAPENGEYQRPGEMDNLFLMTMQQPNTCCDESRGVVQQRHFVDYLDYLVKSGRAEPGKFCGVVMVAYPVGGKPDIDGLREVVRNRFIPDMEYVANGGFVSKVA
jgi:hypothetical protein